MGKDEFDEKEVGKREEKDRTELSKQEEKSAEEKWERDPLGALVWALILIWAGVVLLAGNLGAFDLMSEFAAILLLEVVVRLLVPQYRKSVVGTLVLVGVFVGLGLGTWNCVWPLILIGIGLSIIFRGFQRNNKKEE